MDRGADIGAAGGYELSAAEQARAAGNAAGADDLGAAGHDGRSRRAARTDDLRAGEYRAAAGEAEHEMRAAGNVRAVVGAVGAHDLGAAGEDDRRIGDPARGND